MLSKSVTDCQGGNSLLTWDTSSSGCSSDCSITLMEHPDIPVLGWNTDAWATISRAIFSWSNLIYLKVWTYALLWTLNCQATSVWDYPVWIRPITLIHVARINLGITAFHSNNDNRLFNTSSFHGLFNHTFPVEYMNSFSALLWTSTFIFQVLKNTLGYLPNCSSQYFVF